MQIQWNIGLAIIQLFAIILQQILVHAMTAQLSCHFFSDCAVRIRGYPAKRALSAMRKHGG